MLFNSLEYAVFMAVVFVMFWALARFQAMRLTMLLVASYLFYASWNPSYLMLIVFSSLIDYLLGLRMGSTDDPFERKALLLASVVVNLGVLAIFKYFNFFLTNIDLALGFSGL
ncbi:MAG: MBOAT family protein, partial [Myxococcota bacterium]